ncbi:hypothetical protein E4L95_17465 [Paracoccus liaowanqingii]|uniref:Uncharacterized protein n=1 Tax=Paracoccus liaowanqingii TaxID=2560053 RepID=A0A4Z1CA02_9RHOB|nr:hypothetical protein [Paracoccus liaowanqingii]TGN50456.1 hypothetical protein E4L95_17465 [Paracoccus liaowanqingii]
MTPWIIAGSCGTGAALISWGSARLQMRWPLAILSVLLAAIALQLYLAARGQGGFHDLAAITAQTFTVIPALLGCLAGLALAALRRHPVAWRRPTGILTALALLAAAGLATATLLI